MVQVVTVVSASGIDRRPKHKPELGWFVYLLAGTAVIGGFLFGYDTGVVSAAMLYVPKNNGMTPMSDFWKELVVSITPGFASIGALFGSAAGDHFGRRKVILLASSLFAIGAIVCGIAFDKMILLLGRILIGVGLGFASMIVPIYVGEASPAYIRGILVTGALLVFTIIPLKLVERLGRRILLIASDAGVLLSLVLMGGAFLMINRDSADVSHIESNDYNLSLINSSATNFAHCNSYSNCDLCVTDERCGFCAESGFQRISGYCLPIDPDNSDKQSLTGYCVTNQDSNGWHIHNGTKYEWADVYCHTRFTAIPIILMVVYLAFFSSGFAPMPWVLNAEFYPLWARSTCVAISTFTNWSLNLLISLTFLSLSESATKFGAFFIYAGLTFIGLIVFIIFVPETKGCSIDEVEILFMTEKDRQKIREEMKRPHLEPGNMYDTEMKEF
uniref:Major facilitator superfamily (MFS) profile domain-containing protein n=1 Tax=Acrobeloides nanus TaxID=290746 RepID=A0A914C3C6_9BILA